MDTSTSSNRVSAQFDEVVVTVMINKSKQGMFSVEERMEMLREATAHLPNIGWSPGTACSWISLGSRASVRSSRVCVTRATSATKLQMAQMNKRLSGWTTFFIATNPAFSFLSSSLVKEVATFGGDVTDMLPPSVHKRLLDRLAERRG